MIKVANEITVYEENGTETKVPMPTLSVLSHWNRDSLVVLEIAGQKISVSARDLQAAIANAVNTVRHG
jgi:hypothetical protein